MLNRNVWELWWSRWHMRFIVARRLWSNQGAEQPRFLVI